MLPLAMYCLNFFDISAINDNRCMVFRDAGIVRSIIIQIPLCDVVRSSIPPPSVDLLTWNFKRAFIITNLASG